MAFRRHLQHRATHLPIDFVQCVVNHLSWTVETDSPVWTKYPRRPTKLPLINRSVVTTTRKSVCQFWFGQINRNAQNHPWAWNVKSINIVPQTDIDSLCSLVWIGDNVHRLHFDLFHLIFAEKKTERVTFSVPLRLLLLLLDRILFFFLLCSVACCRHGRQFYYHFLLLLSVLLFMFCCSRQATSCASAHLYCVHIACAILLWLLCIVLTMRIQVHSARTWPFFFSYSYTRYICFKRFDL